MSLPALGRPAAAVVVALLLCVPGIGRAQVSPGPLARAHADLQGNGDCLKCHASRSEGMDSRCLECHEGIASLRSQERGLHARTGDTPCSRCHPDHAGADFDLIAWPGGSEEKFDHLRAGWPLRGKHARTACRDCHRPRNRKDPVAALAKKREASESWIGLGPACGSCHEDAHRGALGVECGSCHLPSDWKTTPGFDHAGASFPLLGKHAQVACARCHRPDGSTVPVYKPLAHAECSDCHTDPHGGRLGPACGSCHDPASFRRVPVAAFDHGRTRYPLEGAHRAVECKRCHDPGTAWGPRPESASCGSCHRDAHRGEATLAGVAVDCAACHSVAGFRPGRLAMARHAPDRFPLEGKHAAVPCAACHTRDTGGSVAMRPPHDRCATCHEDAHGGQLASRPDGGECASCHDTHGWKPSRFGPVEHAALVLPLEGAHGRTTCAACHGPRREHLGALPAGIRTGKAGVGLRGIDTECSGCHRDLHRFEPARRCSACHGVDRFAPAQVGVAEHARFEFPLNGAHGAVPCVTCHRELGVRSGAERELPFRDPRRACVDCHADPHGGQFGERAAARCERCHSEDAFRPASRFDHDRDASFRLGGGHAGLACARCHDTVPGPDGEAVTRYRGVASECRTCHGAETPTAIEGDRS